MVLVTDAVRAAGLPEVQYMLDDRSVLIKDGTARLSDGTLAGSLLTMCSALKNACCATGRPLAETWRASSLNSARSIGIVNLKVGLGVCKNADLVLLDEEFDVQLNVAEGEVVFSNNREC